MADVRVQRWSGGEWWADDRRVHPDDLARAIREGVDARLRELAAALREHEAPALPDGPFMERPFNNLAQVIVDFLAPRAVTREESALLGAALKHSTTTIHEGEISDCLRHCGPDAGPGGSPPAPREPAQDEPASGKCPRKAQDEPAAGVTPDVRALARETVLAAAVLRAAQTFEAYAAMHAAKGSVQGNKKAAVNKHLAENMRAALALSDPPDPTADIPALLAEVRRLREALGKRPCADGGLDRWTVSECIAAGECDCGARAALGEASNG